MHFPCTNLRQKLVAHPIALEALDQARREPSGLYRDLLADIKAEKARRAAGLLADTSSPKEAPIAPSSPA